MSSKTFENVLHKIRTESKSTVELGTRFEKITKDFLETDTQYKKRFAKVHLWKHWKYRGTVSPGGGDIGVDLVAEERNGDWCAIQCKCYDDDGNLNYKLLSTFFTTADLIRQKHKKTVNTVLVYTGDRTTPNADNAIRINQCHVIGQDEFRDSSIIWNDFPKLKAREPKELRHHQKKALKDVIKGLSTADRGKLIMACGTGKTLTSLRIAEKYGEGGSSVLYLVPSISLIHQTMREWSENGKIKHHYAVVCSDKTVGEDEDSDISQLSFPPTTDVRELRRSFAARPKDAMGVIFSTYHSIDVASKAIDGSFDLVLCDEAHRTTGAERERSKDLTHFTKVHYDKYVKAKKRLYMTATPRVYGEAIKNKADVHSMDDRDIYGDEFHNYSFGDAVTDGQLSDFKVRIPVISEEDLKRYTNEGIGDGNDKGDDDEDENGKVDNDEDGTIDERVLLAAVWHGLNYNGDRRQPLLQRVISFSNKIQASKQFAGVYGGDDSTQDEERHAKKSRGKKEDQDSVTENRSFENTVSKYEKTSKDRTGNTVSVRHIDGSMRASIRNIKMRWLKDSDQESNECRILSNARCLSEGVDVPALDGVIFLQPRKSKTDVVQSVGRVMRIAPGKEYGYVILPVVIKAGTTFEQSLHDSKAWKTVWQVLSALRSHNPNFANEINRINLDRSSGGYPNRLENVEIIWMGSHHRIEIEHELFGKLVTKMVEKVGDREYFDEQARKLGEKAKEIRNILKRTYDDGHRNISDTVNGLRKSLKSIVNDTVDEAETINVLAQHHALLQVFDALFPKKFRAANSVVKALDEVMQRIGMTKELEGFEEFYESVRKEAAKFKHDAGRQEYIKKIYGNFLLGFDKKQQEAYGIVYTPNEIIDFIIHSVEYVLQTEFKTGFNQKNINVIDPFTGTGSFITRLLESGLIQKDHMAEKYNDIWANDIKLLAYYVASVNIESVFGRITNSSKHTPFLNINYTDTLNNHPDFRSDKRFRMRNSTVYGKTDKMLKNIERENGSHIHVLMSNPPYSAKQSNANDDNPNTKYPGLDKMIEDTYAKESTVQQKASLYDSYIRAIRWASNRLGKSGIIAFVTNASFIRSKAAAGMRACLEKEFSEIWCFDLRGNQRTKGEASKREGGKIFGTGSRAPVAITILVRNPKRGGSTIRYKDIGDYLSRERKLEIIQNFKSIQGIKDWEIVKPDRHHDWKEQRNEEFSKYIPIGNKDSKKGRSENTIFVMYSRGVATSRDAWAYNSSTKELTKNVSRHINYCNKLDLNEPKLDPRQAKLSRDLLKKLGRPGKQKFDKNKIRVSTYRPFFKQYLYFDSVFNDLQYRIPEFFPNDDIKNVVICVPDKSQTKFTPFITDIIPDLNIHAPTQCFPLYTYENKKKKDNITDYALAKFQNHYAQSTKRITKKDIFYYVYGLLHHPDYKTKFANNLSKEFPHIPLAPDFWAFADVGKKLGDLHLNYETGTKYDLGKPKFTPKRFTEITFDKKIVKENGDDKGRRTSDKSVICDCKTVVFDNIPDIKYRVNGSTPIEWLVDRYNPKRDKDSDITNNPLEEMTGREIINLIRRLVHVGIESDKLIASLPPEFEPEDWEPEKPGLDKFCAPAQNRLL